MTKSFEARRLCDRRRYEYILPAFAFDPACCRGEEALPAHVGAAGNIIEKHAGAELDLEAALKLLPAAGQPKLQQSGAEDENGHSPSLSTAAPSAAEPAAAQCNGSSPPNGAPQADPQHDSSSSAAGEQQPQSKQHSASAAGDSGQQAEARPAAGSSQAGRNSTGAQVLEHYRHVKFTAEQHARLNKILSAYEGTHNFHNYTVRVAPDDPAAMRYILSFKCEGTMEIQVCFLFLSSNIHCSSSCEDLSFFSDLSPKEARAVHGGAGEEHYAARKSRPWAVSVPRGMLPIAGAAVGAHGSARAELHAAPDPEAGGHCSGGHARGRAPGVHPSRAEAGALSGDAHGA